MIISSSRFAGSSLLGRSTYKKILQEINREYLRDITFRDF